MGGFIVLSTIIVHTDLLKELHSLCAALGGGGGIMGHCCGLNDRLRQLLRVHADCNVINYDRSM